MVENIKNIKTLQEFWENAAGVVVDFVNKNGETIDDMDYPLSTKVKLIRHIELDQYEVELDVL